MQKHRAKGIGRATTFLVESAPESKDDFDVVLAVLWHDDGETVTPTDVEPADGMLHDFGTAVEALAS